MRKIDTHVELVDLEVTSNLNDVLLSTQPIEDIQAPLFHVDQPIEEALEQTAEDAA